MLAPFADAISSSPSHYRAGNSKALNALLVDCSKKDGVGYACVSFTGRFRQVL
jgi:hypothetical protein